MVAVFVKMSGGGHGKKIIDNKGWKYWWLCQWQQESYGGGCYHNHGDSGDDIASGMFFVAF